MALVAPRPLLDTAGLRDTWANYESGLQARRAAEVVYKFLGTDGMLADGPVVGDEAMTAGMHGNLVQYRRDTSHTLNRDYWMAILDFADGQLPTKCETRSCADIDAS